MSKLFQVFGILALILFLAFCFFLLFSWAGSKRVDYDFNDANATVMANHASPVMVHDSSTACWLVPAARCGYVTGVAKDGHEEMFASYQAQLPFRSSVYAVVMILILACLLFGAYSAYRRGLR